MELLQRNSKTFECAGRATCSAQLYPVRKEQTGLVGVVVDGIEGLLGELLAEEITDQRGDFHSVFFEGKMPGIK